MLRKSSAGTKHPLAQRITALVLVLAMTGCAAKQLPPLQAGDANFPQPSGYNQYTPEQEVEIGKQVAAEADKQLPLLPARGPVPDYVSTLGARLATNLPPNPYQFNFKVINQKEINAFALPGGPIRINVGTLQAAGTEAELAGVIAHEIAHVYMRHATRNASKASIAQIPAAILGTILGGGAGGQLARLGLGIGMESVFLKYSRDAEREADRVGAKLMYDAGYDPRAMATFFEKLAGESQGRGGPAFLASHPDPGNRAQLVMEAISQLPAKRYVTAGNDFRAAKTAAAKLKPLSAEEVARMQQQRQGSIQNASQESVAPSGSFQTLNHGAFQIAYPSNWKVFAADQNAPVTIAPPAGVSNQAIAYGVIISGYTPQTQQGLSASMSQIYEGLRQSNPELQATAQPRQASVNGNPALVLELLGPSPLTNNGQRVAERDLLVTVQRQDGSVVWLLFISPEPHYQALGSTFQQMIESLRI
ncbi:MAG TPA: M48 family metallopeptidase [Terriglobales bacterium]|nr:M48 family metallopeptidase [Terriglobales bacterium]